MTRLRGMTLAAALVAGLTIPAVSLAASASAEPAENGPWQTYHEGPFSEIQEDFCDVPGLTVDFAFDGRRRMAGRPGSVAPTISPTTVSFPEGYKKYTNVATGESVTLSGGFRQPARTFGSPTTAMAPSRDHVTNKGHGGLYSDDGEVLERYAGCVQLQRSSYNSAAPRATRPTTSKSHAPTILKEVGPKYDVCAIVVDAIG